ncbi:MAG: Hpt domain-containing protein [Desulfovibrio sp.]|nr:Hpt domain-containing protein [Desulfovibrio sp.]MCA1987180.1 Hpt domain-containing protein [Desulfovibrio sp.]
MADLEGLPLRLDQDPADAECIANIFRTMHTIKGSGAMFGYMEIARFTHNIEPVFGKVRSREKQAIRQLINLTFKAKVRCSPREKQPPGKSVLSGHSLRPPLQLLEEVFTLGKVRLLRLRDGIAGAIAPLHNAGFADTFYPTLE